MDKNENKGNIYFIEFYDEKETHIPEKVIEACE